MNTDYVLTVIFSADFRGVNMSAVKAKTPRKAQNQTLNKDKTRLSWRRRTLGVGGVGYEIRTSST